MQQKVQAPSSVPVVLTPEEIADFFRVDLSWVYEKSRRRQRNPIPVHRIGKYLRYNRDEVLAWFAAQAQISTRRTRKA